MGTLNIITREGVQLPFAEKSYTLEGDEVEVLFMLANVTYDGGNTFVAVAALLEIKLS